MRLFITLSLVIHAASLTFFLWHQKQDKKFITPPMSTMVQIVSSPDEPDEEVVEEPSPPLPKQSLKKAVKTETKKIKRSKQPKTLSRKGPSLEELEYAQKLQSFIEKNRFYPQKAWRLKQQGTVVISLTILNNGDFSDLKLIEKSKHASLDKAAISFLEDLKKFKPLPNPNKKKQEYIIPIFYKIGR